MTGIKMNITTEMISHRPERERELTGKLAIGLQKAVLAVESKAKKLCPVDEGPLRSSITSRIEGTEGIIGTRKDYASYVEHGTAKMGAQPFLFPALEQVRAKIAEFFK